jgi:hypothetical protein
MKSCLFIPFFALLIAARSSCPTFAQEDAKPQVTSTEKQKALEKRKAVAAEAAAKRKEKVLAFVRENHPELEQMLSKLEKNKKRQYRAAMQALNKVITQLDNIKEKQPQRYNLGVMQWSIESRIKVALAQIKLDDSKENRDALRALIARQVNFQIERSKFEREATKKRLATLGKRIVDMESKRSKLIENRYKAHLRKIKK